MGKKSRQSRRPAETSAASQASDEYISAVGKKTMAVGVATILLGFIVLSRCDARGSNWAACLSPFLVLGGYLLVGVGIFLPEKSPTSPDVPTPSAGVFEQKKTT
jgi:hypothetical protein